MLVAVFFLFDRHSGKDGRGGAVQVHVPRRRRSGTARGRSLLYWAGLFGISLFIERPFCKYLCPLGAGLAIPTTFRLRAVEAQGRVPEPATHARKAAARWRSTTPAASTSANACCASGCQILYYDAHTCPPLSEGAPAPGTKAGLPLTPIGADGYYIPIKPVK